MRKSLIQRMADSRPEFRFAGVFCLAVLVLVPVSVLASSTTSTANRKHRVGKHALPHHAVRHAHVPAKARPVNVPHPTRHAKPQRPAGRVHRVKRRRRATHASLRRRRHRVEVALENVRTHTAPNAAAIEERATDDSGDSSQSSKAALMAGPQVEPVAQASPAANSFLLFNTAIPHYMPLPLRGSHEVLVHQNIVADVEGLSRIQNDEQLGAMVHAGDLVALPASPALEIDPRLPYNRRYCRPWTEKFLSDIARAHDSIFDRPLQLTSAVRTVNFQRHLAHYNGNAAPAYGDTASPHLTGQAIDIGKKGMSWHEIAWMREVLGHLQAAGKLDVEEEFEQACFHISVYRTYLPRSASSERLIAKNEPANPNDTSTNSDIGGVAPPVVEATPSAEATPTAAAVTHRAVRRTVSYRRKRGYATHHVRHTVVHRRRRRHHRSVSLIAAGIQ